MQVNVSVGAVQEVAAELIVVGLYQGGENLSGVAAAVDQAMQGAVSKVLAEGDFAGKEGATLPLYQRGSLVAQRVQLLGLGEMAKFDADVLRRVSAEALRAAQKLGVKRCHMVVADADSLNPRQAAQAIVEGALLGAYVFAGYAKHQEKPTSVEMLTLLVHSADQLEPVQAGARAGLAIAEAVCLARDLTNQPANYLTPRMLAQQAEQVAREHGFTCRVLDEQALADEKMGAFLGVAQGSVEPPRLIVLEHNAGRDDLETVVIVGKGITFDSGGISIKPTQGMHLMKDDMSGAGVTLGVMRAVADLALPLHVVGLMPATENLPDGRAYKPGDVLTSRSGLTIEVISTDAEGRLILADALDYAKSFTPKAVVDLATLTGGCVVALGHVAAGLMSNDPALVAALSRASAASGEKIWELPLFDEYAQQIESDVADLMNSGGREASAITAGLFLSRFAEGLTWAHLDIAGTAWSEKQHGYLSKGGSGFGVRLLVQWLRDMVAAD